MPDTSIDISAVERLRQHMKLSQSDMATLFEVTRVTYYNWTRGKPVRPANAQRVRVVVRKLVAIVREGWPAPEVVTLPPKERIRRLVALVNAS